MTPFRTLIDLAADGPLSAEDAGAAFAAILDGEATPVQMAGLLLALRGRGETQPEIAAAVGELRARMLTIKGPEDAFDIVGTGGDGKGTLNISTAAAFVIAGAGVPVAKHGNRNISSKSGSADAMVKMGIAVMVAPEIAERALAEAGICFMMAPIHHPTMRYVGPVRSELAVRTIFNMLGPMSNPAGARRQLTGTYSPSVLQPMAQTLHQLGTEAAWLVHGSDGTDEISIAGSTAVVSVGSNGLDTFEISPSDAGLPTHPFEAILGGDPAHNARAFNALLDGEGGAYRDAVLLNSAAGLLIAGRVTSLPDGVEMAAKSLDSGAARRKLQALGAITGAPEQP